MDGAGPREATDAEREAAERLVQAVMIEAGRRRGGGRGIPLPLSIGALVLVLLAVVMYVPALLWETLLHGDGRLDPAGEAGRVLAFAVPAVGFVVGLAWGQYGKERVRPLLLSAASLVTWALLNGPRQGMGRDDLPTLAVLLGILALAFLVAPRRAR